MTSPPPPKSFTDLFTEIIHSILAKLAHPKSHGTIASFQQTSKAHYDIATPHLYRDMLVDQNGLFRLLSLNNDSTLENLQMIRRITLIEVDPTLFKLRDLCKLRSHNRPSSQIHILRNLASMVVHPKRQSGGLMKLVNVIVGWSRVKKFCIRDRETARIKAQWDFKATHMDIVVHSAPNDFNFTADEDPFTSMRVSYRQPICVEDSSLDREIFNQLGRYAMSLSSSKPPKEANWEADATKLLIDTSAGTCSQESIMANVEALMRVTKFLTTLFGTMNFGASYDQKLARVSRWLDDIEWVVGKKEIEKEPPCEVCGSE